MVLGCGGTQPPANEPAASPPPETTAQVATVEQVLKQYRSSPEWKQSRDAFRKIMRKHLHGHSGDWTDAELDEEFESFITLSQDEFELFLKTHSCQPHRSGEKATYYSVHATHQRHDAYAQIPSPHPPTGNGKEHVRSAFSANLLMQRFDVNHATPLPKRATMAKSPFKSWLAIEEVMTSRQRFDEYFQFHDPAQADSVFEFTRKLEWGSKVVGDVFVAPELHGGKYFSPALFATYVFRANEDSRYSVFLVIAATGRGAPAHPYIGLIENGEPTYRSTMRTVFDFLSTGDNLLRYRLVVNDENPLVLSLFMSTAYPTHPDTPYITIMSTYGPIVEDEKLHKFLKSPSTKMVQMIKKASLLKDLFQVYYPEESEAELWYDLEAIKRNKGFIADLEAAGLTAATDVFGRDLWAQKPTIERQKDAPASTTDPRRSDSASIESSTLNPRPCP